MFVYTLPGLHFPQWACVANDQTTRVPQNLSVLSLFPSSAYVRLYSKMRSTPFTDKIYLKLPVPASLDRTRVDQSRPGPA